MGWREFRAWIREMNRSRTVEAARQQTDPDSWAGQGSDGWWVEQAAKRDRMRGR